MKYRYMTLAQCERHRMRKRAWRRLRGKRKAANRPYNTIIRTPVGRLYQSFLAKLLNYSRDAARELMERGTGGPGLMGLL